jgi:flagellar biosynthetic protein FlhB
MLFVGALLGAVLGAVASLGASIAQTQDWLRAALELAKASTALGTPSMVVQLGEAGALLSHLLGPVLGGALAGALLAAVAQVGVRLRVGAAERASGERPSAGGLLRERMLDLGLAALFACTLAACAAWLLAPSLRGVLALPSAGPAFAGQALLALGRETWPAWAAALLAIGLVDLLQRRLRHALRLRMSRTEQRDEQRETEGDQHVRAARAQRMRAGDGTR